MAVSVLLGLAAWGFCVIVLAVQPQRAYGLSRGSFRLSKEVVAPPENGICASSVTVHGYKCQELEVRNSKLFHIYIYIYLIYDLVVLSN
jgi:lysosomal acid lipase/cholesteryl ester hydrolase